MIRRYIFSTSALPHLQAVLIASVLQVFHVISTPWLLPSPTTISYGFLSGTIEQNTILSNLFSISQSFWETFRESALKLSSQIFPATSPAPALLFPAPALLRSQDPTGRFRRRRRRFWCSGWWAAAAMQLEWV